MLDEFDKYREMMFLLQVAVVLGFEMECLQIGLSGIHPVCCLVIPVFDIECLLILYHKLFQLV